MREAGGTMLGPGGAMPRPGGAMRSVQIFV
jgi:hypothetical protein